MGCVCGPRASPLPPSPRPSCRGLDMPRKGELLGGGGGGGRRSEGRIVLFGCKGYLHDIIMEFTYSALHDTIEPHLKCSCSGY